MDRRIYISDVHISSTDAVHPATGQPYGWLSEAESSRLCSFLLSDEVQACDQLFLVGDVVDLWAYPIDVRPRSFSDIMAAPHNAPIVAALRRLVAEGKALAYIIGNHDMQVTNDEVRAVFPQMAMFRAPFRQGKLFVEHGHERCLFNGSDPRPDMLPFGYFITRLTTTGEVRRGSAIKANLWTILRNAGYVLSLAQGDTSLGAAVFDVCVSEVGVGLNERIVMPDGSSIRVGDVRDLYTDCFERWNATPGRNSAVEAVSCEWDPFYGLPFMSGENLTVAGHSHNHIFSYRHSDRKLYMNTGSWCTNESYFARTWREEDVLWGALYEWLGTGARHVNRAGVAFH